MPAETGEKIYQWNKLGAVVPLPLPLPLHRESYLLYGTCTNLIKAINRKPDNTLIVIAAKEQRLWFVSRGV